jgi:uncharacterized protein
METNENIKLLIRPNSSKNLVVGLYNNIIKIKICSLPEKGKANKKLIDFLSSILKIPKQDIEIIHGEFSNLKEIKVKNMPKDIVISCLLKK